MLRASPDDWSRNEAEKFFHNRLIARHLYQIPQKPQQTTNAQGAIAP